MLNLSFTLLKVFVYFQKKGFDSQSLTTQPTQPPPTSAATSCVPPDTPTTPVKEAITLLLDKTSHSHLIWLSSAAHHVNKLSHNKPHIWLQGWNDTARTRKKRVHMNNCTPGDERWLAVWRFPVWVSAVILQVQPQTRHLREQGKVKAAATANVCCYSCGTMGRWTSFSKYSSIIVSQTSLTTPEILWATIKSYIKVL